MFKTLREPTLEEVQQIIFKDDLHWMKSAIEPLEFCFVYSPSLNLMYRYNEYLVLLENPSGLFIMFDELNAWLSIRLSTRS